MDWKNLRDAMVKELRETLSKDTPPELMMLMAKFEVKLNSMMHESEWNAFNELADRVNIETRIEMLKKLTA